MLNENHWPVRPEVNVLLFRDTSSLHDDMNAGALYIKENTGASERFWGSENTERDLNAQVKFYVSKLIPLHYLFVYLFTLETGSLADLTILFWRPAFNHILHSPSDAVSPVVMELKKSKFDVF